MNASIAVTTRQHFDNLESAALFSVNPGVPIDEALAAADAFINKELEAAIIQTLSEIAKALINATKQGAGAGKP